MNEQQQFFDEFKKETSQGDEWACCGHIQAAATRKQEPVSEHRGRWGDAARWGEGKLHTVDCAGDVSRWECALLLQAVLGVCHTQKQADSEAWEGVHDTRTAEAAAMVQVADCAWVPGA